MGLSRGCVALLALAGCAGNLYLKPGGISEHSTLALLAYSVPGRVTEQEREKLLADLAQRIGAAGVFDIVPGPRTPSSGTASIGGPCVSRPVMPDPQPDAYLCVDYYEDMNPARSNGLLTVVATNSDGATLWRDQVGFGLLSTEMEKKGSSYLLLSEPMNAQLGERLVKKQAETKAPR